MTEKSNTAALAALYARPAHHGPRTSPADELRAAAEILRARDDWASGTLMWWLADTAMLHVPEDGRCARDEDTWPCHDIQAARKVAEAIRIMNPAGADR